MLISGGGGRNRLLLDLIAAALNHPVRRVELRSATATGAALIAARCVGSDLPVTPTLGEVVEPDQDFGPVLRQWSQAVGLPV